ncbi:MAG TPA: GtrA family protein [Mycobacteriales bacterium]|nr:GtrA family protein [Mycobacteriales bacterium]
MSQPLVARVRPVVSELGKFLVVGGFCFALDTLLAYVFRFHAGLGPTTAKTLSTVLATGVSYAGNRLWSFSHRVDGDSTHKQDLSLYAAINMVGLVITLVPVDVAHYLLDATSPLAFTISGILGTAVATVFRFWAYRRWVFDLDPDLAERTALV